MKKKKYLMILIIILLITIVISGLLLNSIYSNLDLFDYEGLSLVKTETIYIVLALAILLLFLLIYILHTLMKRRRTIKRRNDVMKNKSKQKSKTRKIVIKKPKIDEIKASIENVDFIMQVEEKEGIKNDKEKEKENRFFMLSELDYQKEALESVSYNEDITLEEFCNDFRDYSAHKLNLYYDIHDIRRFVCSLAVTNITIIQGMSGTGKTSLAYAFGEFIDNPTVIVPVQPMWKERTDLIGYYNEFTQKFNETTLLQKLYEANYSEGIYISLLDEVNIARIEYYFAEFLSLLELPDCNKRNLDVVSNKWENDPALLNKGQIKLPSNMWFVGTANNDDSTFAISDKVYDRAMVINLDNRAEPYLVNKSKIQRITAKKFYELVDQAQKQYSITDRNLRRINKLDKYLIANFNITFGNRIMHQIKNYVPVVVASGGEELLAIDDILSKKVLRKLEAKNLAYVKSVAQDLISFIDELFGETQMIQCKEYIMHIEKNV